MEHNCAFCVLNIYDRYLDEGKHSYVLLSNPRVAVGHLLVIPKRHVQKFSDLHDEEGKEIFQFLGKYQNKVLEKLSSATEIRQNYKPFLNDSRTHVNHFHFHIIPRDDGDALAKEVDVHRKPFYVDLTDDEKIKVTTLLKPS